MGQAFFSDRKMATNWFICRAWSSMITLCIVGLAFAFPAFGQTPTEEKEAMEIGGVVTLDYGSPVDNFDDQSLEIGTVELSAVVNVNPRIKGFITLLAESNLSEISINQAVGDLTFESIPLEVLFGQQTFNLGLMTTHLISSPLGYDLVGPTQPGITGLFALKTVTLGLGVLMLETASTAAPQYVVTTANDTVALEAGEGEKSRSIGGVINFDYAFLDGSLVRLSSIVSPNNIDLDLACGVGLGNLTIDAEIYSKLAVPRDQTMAGSYSIGLAYDITDKINVAIRHDGFSEDQFNDLTMRVGVGTSVKVLGDCFVAFEYGYEAPDDGDAISTIALQVGLESTLKLPGFQRKTLTRE